MMPASEDDNSIALVNGFLVALCLLLLVWFIGYLFSFPLSDAITGLLGIINIIAQLFGLSLAIYRLAKTAPLWLQTFCIIYILLILLFYIRVILFLWKLGQMTSP